MNTKDAIDALAEFFPDIVSKMNTTFNSHQFLRKLSQKHQKEYIEALYTYREHITPFQILHSKISQRLANSGLAEKIGETTSTNIFGETDKDVSEWRKK